MPAIHISRSKEIEAPVHEVYSKLNDFNHWVKWSPWLIMEPEANVTVSDDAKYYEWNGEKVGEGNMSVTGEQENNWIEYDLNFLKPWKSEAKVKFELSESGEHTEVTWSMDSKLPFFMFWMKKMMEGFVGMDYERGLTMLKDYIEKEEIESTLEPQGESIFPESKYIGVETTCGFDELGEAMMADFGKLEEFMQKHEDIANQQAYSIYHKWQITKGTATYTAAVGVSEFPKDIPSDFVQGTIPETKVYTMRHIGSYDHLGNAWATMMNLSRSKEFKQKRGIHPFEHYISDPKSTEPKDTITDVVFPIK